MFATKGRGMTSEDIAQIGGLSTVRAKHHEQHEQGLGLGLVLVQKLAAVHGAPVLFTASLGRVRVWKLVFLQLRVGKKQRTCNYVLPPTDQQHRLSIARKDWEAPLKGHQVEAYTSKREVYQHCSDHSWGLMVSWDVYPRDCDCPDTDSSQPAGHGMQYGIRLRFVWDRTICSDLPVVTYFIGMRRRNCWGPDFSDFVGISRRS